MNFTSSQSPAAAGARSNTGTTALALLAVMTLFRLWYITRLELVADEAYYWVWSKHLAASYNDKGPAIAWIIAAGTWLFGDTPFGIRWLGVLLCAATGWQIFRLARRLYDDRVALWCLVVALIMPLFAVGSILMTIDSPSLFCWVWAANVFWTALESGKTRHWFGLGLIIGAGFLAKFTNGVQLGCIALFLLWSLPHRRFLFSRQTLALAAAFGLCSLPMIWWNYQVGWLHVVTLRWQSGAEHSFRIRPLQLLQFLVEQLGVISPLIALGMAVAAAALLVSRHRDPRVRFLLCQFLPLYGIFTFFSLNAAGKSNWPAPALITGIVLLVVFWRELTQQRPRWRWTVYAGLGVAGVMTAVLHVAPFLSIPGLHGLMKRAQGWPDYAAHIERARAKYNAPLLIANHYSQASLAQYYLADHPRVFLPTGWNRQYKLWGEYQLAPGECALFITNDIKEDPDNLKRPLKSEFQTRTVVDDFWTQRQGKNLTHFRIYLMVAAGPEPSPQPVNPAAGNSPPPSAAN
jgi:4-amino-4-deoxy-L-arabinose transferase-like glycosyltransferase